MTIAGFAIGANQGYLYLRGEYPEAEARVTDGHRRGARRRPARCRHPGLRASPSTSSCGAAPAPTSAARRRRSSSRSRASAASRATSRRSRSRSGCSASRPSSTTSRRWPTSRSSCAMGGEAYARDRHGGLDRPEAVLPVRPRRPTGHLRGRVRGDAARPHRAGRRRQRHGRDPGHPARRRGRACSSGRTSLDLPLTFEATRAAGATLGSGVIMVFDTSVDLVDTLRRIAQFFRDESCGQCVPCRVGSVRQEELLARLAAGSRVRSRDDELVAAARDRPGDARRVDLRARPDRVVGHRVGAAPARIWWRCDRRAQARRPRATRPPGGLARSMPDHDRACRPAAIRRRTTTPRTSASRRAPSR